MGNTKLGGNVNELNKITVIVKDYFYKFDSRLGYGILENMITGYKVELDSEATNKCNHSNKWITYYIVENRTFLDKGV